MVLPLANSAGKKSDRKILYRYGVPFVEGTLHLPPAGSIPVNIGGPVKRIFLLGMTEDANLRAWADPRDYSIRFFIGDQMGKIRLDYADGSTQVFPLILGDDIWWGHSFYLFSDPFPTDARLRKSLASALRLFSPAPMQDGNYVAVITPKASPLRSITIEDSPAKKGMVEIAGITVETAESNEIAGASIFPPGDFPPKFRKFTRDKTLRPLGVDENQTQRHLNDLRKNLYTSNDEFHGHVPAETPRGYSGPEISFKGDIFANILENAFYANLQDMLAKVDKDGTYHTSTRGAVSWGGSGFGTFRTNVGMYYGASWSRDMGRSLQELTELGYTNETTRSADYCLRMARLWEERSSLKVDGEFLPRHWGRVANRPDPAVPFENDGHGMVTLSLYKLWQRLPNRDEWLRSHWVDVKAAGDWILWQFDHPEISKATDGVLYTTGESAAGKGNSVYADYVCMDALQALAQMADSIGENQSAKRWQARAERMRKAIAARYIVDDPKYGRIWTLDFAGWPDQSTVLGPLIFSADYQGFAPEDEDPSLRLVNEAAYQRLIDTYRPFGFYGQAMGYGQGFVTQSALLLDRMRDSTQMLDWAAKEIYDPRFDSFIVPEGVQIDPTGRFWYRTGDLGNGVQEAEIIKTLRLVVGVDDTQPNRLQLFPRMPYDWKEITVKKYPVLLEHWGKMDTALLRYKLERSANRMKLDIGSNQKLGPVTIRLGPFKKQPNASSIQVNGKDPAGTSIEHSGDSWWVRFTMSVGPDAGTLDQARSGLDKQTTQKKEPKV